LAAFLIVEIKNARDQATYATGPQHAELKAMRQRSADTNMILLEGVSHE